MHELIWDWPRRLLTMDLVVVEGPRQREGPRASGVVVIDRLSVLCFAGTYSLALLAELARFVVQGSIRWYLAASLMALGWLVQTAFLANVAIQEPRRYLFTTRVRVGHVALVDRGSDRAVPDGSRSPKPSLWGFSCYRSCWGWYVAGACSHRVNPTGSIGVGRSSSGVSCMGFSCSAGRFSRAWRFLPD